MLKLKTCTVCKEPKLSIEFNKNKRKKDGLQTHCRICSQEKFSKYYNENKEKHKKKIVARNKSNRHFVQRYVLSYLKEHPCACGESDPAALDFDHVRGTKIKAISMLVSGSYSIETIKLEIEKCTVMCANCHRKKTAKDFGWYQSLGL